MDLEGALVDIVETWGWGQRGGQCWTNRGEPGSKSYFINNNYANVFTKGFMKIYPNQ